MTIPQYNLRTATFNPIAFNPIGYTPQTPDVSIMERSLQAIENRRNIAAQQKSQLDTALGEIESKLNPAEAQWFNDYKANINNQISDSMAIGDYGNAIRTAIDLGGKTAKDSAILSRIKANEDYNNWDKTLQNRLAKGEISQDTYKWSIANNPYQFNETLDANGNVVGGQLADTNPIYNTIKWDELMAKAVSLIRPNTIQTDNAGGGNNPSRYNAGNDGIAELDKQIGVASNSWRRGHSIEQVTSEEILDSVGALLNIPDLKEQAIQDWQVSVWKYDQATDLNNADIKTMREQGFIKNGEPLSLQDYLNDKVQQFAKQLAYIKENTTTANESGFNFSGGIGTAGANLGSTYTDKDGNKYKAVMGNGGVVEWVATNKEEVTPHQIGNDVVSSFGSQPSKPQPTNNNKKK